MIIITAIQSVLATACKLSFAANFGIIGYQPFANVVVNGVLLKNGDAVQADVGSRVNWQVTTDSVATRIASCVVNGTERIAGNIINISGSFLAATDVSIVVQVVSDRFCYMPTPGNPASPIYLEGTFEGPCGSIVVPEPPTTEPIVILPPIAEANGPYVNLLGVATVFSSAGSSDPQALAITYLWDFGDGATSTSANPTHTYAAIGNYSARLKVTNSAGKYAYDSAPVRVYTGALSAAPVAEANGPYETLFGEATTFSSAGSYDPNGLTLFYHWDFGDGESSEEANPKHLYKETQTYVATLTVTNTANLTASDTTPVLIYVVVIIPPKPTNPGELAAFYSALGISKNLRVRYHDEEDTYSAYHEIDLLTNLPNEWLHRMGRYRLRQWEFVHIEDVPCVIVYVEAEVNVLKD